MGVVIGIRSIEFLLRQLHISVAKTVLYTDSQCVLHWINTKRPLPVFVQNRIKEIKAAENVFFQYINTKENPADIATRGN